MCVTAAISFDGGALIATDTRWSYEAVHEAEPPMRLDLGGKLWRSPGGFATGTGDGVLTKLIRDEADSIEDAVTFEASIRRVFEAHGDEIKATFADHRLDRTSFLFVPFAPTPVTERIRCYLGDGSPMDLGPTNYVLSLPPELSEEQAAAIRKRFLATASQAEGIGGFVRAIAGAVRDAAALAESVSREVDIGLVHDPSKLVSILRRPATLLAQTATPEIVAAFQGRLPPSRSIHLDAGVLTAGLLQNAAGSTFVNLDATGTEAFIQCGSDLVMRANGTAEFGGTVSSSTFTATNMFIAGAMVWPNGGILSEFSTEMRIEGGGGSVGIGRSDDDLNFFQAGAAARQTVTGSRGGNAALASLLSALEAYGLIVDSTS